jgi:hypothetical protein
MEYNAVPEMQYAVTAFLDILGFGAMVESDSRATLPVHLPKILEVTDAVHATFARSGVGLRVFSDSIIISAPLDPAAILTLIRSCANLQRLFIERGVLLRGGIAFGKHYQDERVLFSSSLVGAYLLESKRARFPRILIDRNTLDYFWNDPDTGDSGRAEFSGLILRDRDGEVFVNYLSGDFVPFHETLIRSYAKTVGLQQGTVLEKIQWLFAYHNHVARLVDHAEASPDGLPLGFTPYP